MKNKDKRGLLLNTVIEYTIAALVLVALVSLAPTIYGILMGTNEDIIKAKIWDNSLVDALNLLKDGEDSQFTLLAPTRWGLVYFDKDATNSYADRPSMCYNNYCLCICKKRIIGGYDCSSNACRVVSKKVKIEEGIGARVDLRLISKIDVFEIIAFKQEVSPAKLTNSMALKVESCKRAFEEKGYNIYITNASQKYKIQESKIKAVICQESDVIKWAVSCAGAGGLMQLMPVTARGLRLNVPEYGTEDISQTVPCKNDKGLYTKVSLCNKLHPANCDYENDGRFDAEKNIMAGAEHLAGLEKSYGSFDVMLAAYNWGGGNLEKKCPSLELGQCPLPKETTDYISAVMAYLEYFATA